MKTLTISSIALLLMCGGSAPLTAQVADDWRIRHPLPYNANLFNAAYGNGVYVIVGAGGAIITSGDLETWHSVHHPEQVENVVFGDGQFVVTGFSGDILTSADGTNWTTHASGTSMSLSAVEYGGGLYVAAGQQGVSAVSSNGVDWSAGSTGEAAQWYYGMAYGAGRFVAVSYGDYDTSLSGRISTSTNGMDWTTVTLPGGLPSYVDFADVGYGNGRFTAVGFWEDAFNYGPLVMTSTDGLTWTRVTDPDLPVSTSQYNLWTVGHDGTQWIGAGENGLVITSADGLNWALLAAPLDTTTDFFGITFGPGGRIVPVGTRGKVYSTTNLSTWVENSSGSFSFLSRMAFNGTQYLAGAGGGVLISNDGTTWTRITTGLNGRITGATYGLGRWVISSDSISASTHHALGTSTNGSDWVLPTTSAEFDDCRGVAFGNDIFVAIPKSGLNSLAYSTNGLDWTEVPHPWFTLFQDRNYLAFGGGQFLAWGHSGHSTSNVNVAVSTDGMNWQIHDTGTRVLPGLGLVAGAYGDGRWVLAGHEGKVITSTDLMNWNEQTILFDGQVNDLNGVAYGDGQWVIVGDNQRIWSSTDGVNWHESFQTQLSTSFGDVAYDGSSFWACGAEGAIYKSQMAAVLSPPTLAIRKTGNPMEAELLIGGITGQMWDLIHSPILPAPSWSHLTTITLTNNNHPHTLPLPAGSIEGYYRLRSP